MDTSSAKRLLKSIPGLQRAATSRWAKALRYRWALHFENRQGYTFTQFVRLPSQIDALTGPVMKFLGMPAPGEALRIVVIGCSSGAEPYTLSSILLERLPHLAFTIDAYDIDREVLAVARGGVYPMAQVTKNALVDAAFVAATFDRDGDNLVVKPRVAERVRFHAADATDPNLRAQIAPADIVFAQNIMCNLRRASSRRVFDNAAALLKPRAALFVDGMDPDMRASRTRKHGLVPLDVNIERIHHEAERVRGERYPGHAAGLEPFDATRRDRNRRYATIFLRGAADA